MDVLPDMKCEFQVDFSWLSTHCKVLAYCLKTREMRLYCVAMELKMSVCDLLFCRILNSATVEHAGGLCRWKRLRFFQLVFVNIATYCCSYAIDCSVVLSIAENWNYSNCIFIPFNLRILRDLNTLEFDLVPFLIETFKRETIVEVCETITLFQCVQLELEQKINFKLHDQGLVYYCVTLKKERGSIFALA